MELIGKIATIEKNLQLEIKQCFFITIKEITVYTQDLDILNLCVQALTNKLTVKISYEKEYLTITRIIIQSN